MDDKQKQDLVDKYKVSDDEIELIAKDIIEKEMSHLSSPKKPTIIFTGGQAGAGKGGITRQQLERFNNDIAVVDADLYRNQHPKNSEIKELYPEIASSLNHQAGARIGNKIRDSAFEKNANVMFDQTSRTPDGIKAIKNRVAKEGKNYDIELHVLASDLDTSRMRVHSRYEDGGGAENGGRYVDDAFQEKSYKSLADTVKVIEDEKTVDRIVLYNKYVEPIYDNKLINGEWENKPQAHKTLLDERQRELTSKEKKDLAQGWQKVKFKMNQREASTTEPSIAKIAEEGIKKAENNHGLKIKDPQLTKPGRTYTGTFTEVSKNGKALQQNDIGNAYIHNTQDLGLGRDKIFGQNLKVKYDQNMKAELSGSSLDNEHSKQLVKNHNIGLEK